MLSLNEQLDILNSDPAILNRTRQEKTPTGYKFGIGGEVFPDGNDAAVIIEGERSLAMLTQWCNIVRETWNARHTKKEIDEASKEDARRPVDSGRSAHADNERGGDGAVEADLEGSEASMEESLRTKIAVLDRARNRWEDRRATARSELDKAEGELTRIMRAQRDVQKMLEYYKELTSDTRKVRKEDSPPIPEATELGEGRIGEGGPVVRQPVQGRKRGRPQRNQTSDGYHAREVEA